VNRLEQYIRDRKSRFEEEPPAGHFERMQQKMNCKSRRTGVLRWSISIAASIAILFLAGFIRQYVRKQDAGMAVCENVINMKDCYLNKMNVVAGQIEILSQNLDQWDRQQVMIDVQNIIDTANSDFESEIPEELPANEAKLILSNYYRQNLESLEMIAKELRTINYEL
jgi:hypothetical protein